MAPPDDVDKRNTILRWISGSSFIATGATAQQLEEITSSLVKTT